MSTQGHCLCGAATYEAAGDPMSTVMCHCTDCQRGSGAAASVNVVVPRDGFAMHGDTLTKFETVGTDSGRPRERWFCNRCGSPIATFVDELPDFAIIKAGTLDDPSVAAPAVEIWRDSAQPAWHPAGDRPQMPRGMPAAG